MNHIQTNQPCQSIPRAFPGPFEARAGRDGVDLTFDVVCITTEKTIVSARYWDARDEASSVAEVIVDALNGTIRPRRRRLEAPGPFVPELSETPPSLVDVVCQTTDQFIIGIDYWCSDDAIQIGEWISIALNKHHS
ncbi:MAG: hypothetical protein AAFV88_22840 [Planctomycetota bacterium]